MRVGIGYDVHRFNGPPARGARAGKRPLRLGGVTIPFRRGLGGHSDADVLLHALADALLGAVGAPDLGEQFPSSDRRYRNADSRTFVRAAFSQVRRKGWSVGNVDATVIADAPRLTAHKSLMRRAIGQLLAIDASRVSVKAKTTEGFAPGTGGIAAQAVVLLQRARGSGLSLPATPKSRTSRAAKAGAQGQGRSSRSPPACAARDRPRSGATGRQPRARSKR